MLTSGPFWGIAVAHFSNAWGGYTMLTTLPKYFHDVLHFDLATVSTSDINMAFHCKQSVEVMNRLLVYFPRRL